MHDFINLSVQGACVYCKYLEEKSFYVHVDMHVCVCLCMILSKKTLLVITKLKTKFNFDREAWITALHDVTKSWTHPSY